VQPLTKTQAKKRRTDYNRYLKSDAWRLKRSAVMHRDGGRCACVVGGKKCFSQVGIQVHHLTYARFGNENLSDLITVCDSCHKAIHSKQGVKHYGEK